MTRLTRSSLVLIALPALLLTGASTPTSTALGRVVRAASMHDRRADHIATLLPDGRVLIAGGMVENGIFLNSAELFDPARGTFVATASMQSRRVEHSATVFFIGMHCHPPEIVFPTGTQRPLSNRWI